jgi:hypothetical protein
LAARAKLRRGQQHGDEQRHGSQRRFHRAGKQISDGLPLGVDGFQQQLSALRRVMGVCQNSKLPTAIPGTPDQGGVLVFIRSSAAISAIAADDHLSAGGNCWRIQVGILTSKPGISMKGGLAHKTISEA